MTNLKDYELGWMEIYAIIVSIITLILFFTVFKKIKIPYVIKKETDISIISLIFQAIIFIIFIILTWNASIVFKIIIYSVLFWFLTRNIIIKYKSYKSSH